MKRSELVFSFIVIAGIFLWINNRDLKKKIHAVETNEYVDRDEVFENEVFFSSSGKKVNEEDFLNDKGGAHSVISVDKDITKSAATAFTLIFKNTPQASQPTQKLTFPLNREAAPIDFESLLTFLERQSGHDKKYLLDVNDCKHFAQELYRLALQQNILAHFITIDLQGRNQGHAAVAFPTTNQGTVFVDFTPGISPTGKQVPQKKLVWIEGGQPYMTIPLSLLSLAFDNRYEHFREYYDERQKILDEILSLNDKKQILQEDIQEFKEDIAHRGLTAEEHNHYAHDINSRIEDLKDREAELSDEIAIYGTPISEIWVVDRIKAYPPFL